MSGITGTASEFRLRFYWSEYLCPNVDQHAWFNTSATDREDFKKLCAHEEELINCEHVVECCEDS
jgi:hypothetical protein